MNPSQQQDNTRRARAFIDKIMEINREHGMGDKVSSETYERVVDETSKTFEGLLPRT